jgi:hypothetical protein
MPNEPVLPLPDDNATFLSDLRTFLAGEIPEILGRYFPGDWVFSGGLHGTAAGMVSPAFATEAFTAAPVSGGPANRVTADGQGGVMAIDYAAVGAATNDLVWVAISAADTPTLVGTNFQRAGASNYYVDAVSSLQPSVPTNATLLMQVVITGGAITSVVDLAQRFPGPRALGFGLQQVALSAQSIDNVTWGPTGTTGWNGKVFLPDDWNPTSNLTLSLLRHATVPGGVAKMGYQVLRVRDGAALAVLTATAAIDFPFADTQSHLVLLTLLGASLLAGDTLVVQMTRFGDDVGDTNTGFIGLDGVWVTYTPVVGTVPPVQTLPVIYLSQASENVTWAPTGATGWNTRFRLPLDWNSGTDVTLRVLRRASVGSGTSKLTYTILRARDGTAPVTVTAVTAVDFTPGDTNDHLLALTVPGASFQAGDGVIVALGRLGDDAGDTHTGFVLLDGVYGVYSSISRPSGIGMLVTPTVSQASDNATWTPTGSTAWNVRILLPSDWSASSFLQLNILRRATQAAGTARMAEFLTRFRELAAPLSIGASPLDFTPGDTNQHLVQITIPATSLAIGDSILASVSRSGDDLGDTQLGTITIDAAWITYRSVIR